MKKSSQSGFSAIILAVIIFLILAGGGLIAWKQGWIPKLSTTTQTPMPSPASSDIAAGWKTFTSADNGATFHYPESLSAIYVRPQEWPPKLLINNAGFSCEEGGLGINGRPGMTIQKKINDIIYCIENVSEGAAGTVYTDYTYTFLKDSKLIKFSFTLAYPQCANYSDPQKTECEQERQTFDLDVLINRIAESVQL